MYRLGACDDTRDTGAQTGCWFWFGSATVGTIFWLGDHGRLIVWLCLRPAGYRADN